MGILHPGWYSHWSSFSDCILLFIGHMADWLSPKPLLFLDTFKVCNFISAPVAVFLFQPSSEEFKLCLCVFPITSQVLLHRVRGWEQRPSAPWRRQGLRDLPSHCTVWDSHLVMPQENRNYVVDSGTIQLKVKARQWVVECLCSKGQDKNGLWGIWLTETWFTQNTDLELSCTMQPSLTQ
jgi:hypothetical protein